MSRQQQIPMTATRRTALVAGIFYLVSFVSIPTLFLYHDLKNHPGWVLGSGSTTGVLWGGFLEVIVAIAGIGTAVTLFPVVRRQNEGLALGFVAIRTLEAGMIYSGVVALHSLVSLHQTAANGVNAAALVTSGRSLVATYNWTFMLGQSLSPALSAMVLGTLMYRSGLVPRFIPVMGLVGGPLLALAIAVTLLGGIEQTNPLAGLAALPVALWELSLGVYLTVKGFRATPITEALDAPGPVGAPRPAVAH